MKIVYNKNDEKEIKSLMESKKKKELIKKN